MPEISARDLKRLQGLDERLRKAQDERRRLAGEAKAARAEAESTGRAAGRLAGQLNALVEENRTLSAELDAARGDLDRAAGEAADARGRAQQAAQEAEAARAAATQAQAEIKRLRVASRRLEERIEAAEAQLAGKAVEPLVPPSRVAELVDKFVSELGTGMSGLEVSRGELRLRVGVGLVGDQPGFVVPSALGERPNVENLQDVTLQFDRRLRPPGDQS